MGSRQSSSCIARGGQTNRGPIANDWLRVRERQFYIRVRQTIQPHAAACLTGKAKWQRAIQLVHALARLRPSKCRHDYAAIMLNHNSSVLVHADRFNYGPSSFISFGCHLDGQLWVEEQEGDHIVSIEGEELPGRLLDTHGQWQTFAAQARHCVTEASPPPGENEAERFSISLFCPGRLTEVTDEIWCRLERFGCPVTSLKRTCGSEPSEAPAADRERSLAVKGVGADELRESGSTQQYSMHVLGHGLARADAEEGYFTLFGVLAQRPPMHLERGGIALAEKGDK
eukprot:1468303-Amphidinium_carterae.1